MPSAGGPSLSSANAMYTLSLSGCMLQHFTCHASVFLKAESMNTRYLVIDGYCLMHRDPSLVHLIQENLMLARQRLVRDVAATGDAFADAITIVFDGRTGSGDGFAGTGVTVVFSASGESADTVIERMISQSEEAEEFTVVTSDRAIIDIVTAAGARIVSCDMFLEYRKEGEQRARRQIRRTSGKAPNQLGDYFPE